MKKTNIIKHTEKYRLSDSGASRDESYDKLDYHKFNHPIVEWIFAQYMHQHRKLRDGSLRDGDNWQKGFPIDWILGSARRHMVDWELLEKGYEVLERGEQVDLIETLCAIRFNVNARLLELLKDTKRIERNESK
jgi:hypothetical protein